MAEFNSLSGNPDGLQVVNPVLTNVAVQYRPHGFIYDRLVNNFPVMFNEGQYPFFDMGGFYASGDGRAIADDAATPLVDFKVKMEKYHCLDYRKAVRITRKELLQAHPALHLEESKILGLAAVFAGEREARLAAKLRDKTNGGQLTAEKVKPTVKWDEGTKTTEATIQKDIQTAMKNVKNLTGRWPNTLVLTKEIAYAIAMDYTIKEQIKYILGPQQIAQGVGVLPDMLFGLKTIVVDGVQVNTAAEGEATNLSEVWGKSARVLYINENPAWGEPTIAYGFRGRVQDGFAYSSPAVSNGGPVAQLEPNAATQWTVVDQWSEPDPPANRYRLWECVDERIVAPELGSEIEAVIA
jgi:hypothetical protein